METPPVQAPKPEPAAPKQFPWVPVVLALIVVAIGSSVITYAFVTKRMSLVPTPLSSPTPEISDMISESPIPEPEILVSPTSAPSCDVSDSTLCTVISDFKRATASRDAQAFLAYQPESSVTCDPDGMAISVCEGEAKGVVKTGYSIGYNESEGSLLSRNDYISSLISYMQENVYSYYGTAISGDKAAVVFLNPAKDKLMLFPMKRSGATWWMSYVLVGGVYGNSAILNLSLTLLDMVR